MQPTEFVIEGTFEGGDGRAYVVARVIGARSFRVMPDGVLGGCRVEQWVEMPRALDASGRQRTDLFGFCLKTTADRSRFKVDDRVSLEAGVPGTMGPSEDHYRGALLGLALGDAVGAPHEGGPLERVLWRLLGSTKSGLRRFTDDTQMALDVAESLLGCGDVDQDDLATRFSRSYRWDRGYGPGAAKILRRIRSGKGWREASRSVYPTGSFGNGGAMRAPVVGLFFHRCPDRLASAARRTAEVTHSHPLGMEGAALVAEATVAALDGADGPGILGRAATAACSGEYVDALALASSWLGSRTMTSAREVRARLGMGITATRSCVTALYLAGRFLQDPLEALLTFATEAGGDVDTVGAMAGAIWGARNGFGSLPPTVVGSIEDAPRIGDIATQLYRRSRTLGKE